MNWKDWRIIKPVKGDLKRDLWESEFKNKY